MFGLNFLNPVLTGATMGDGRPNNSLSDMNALARAYKEARAAKHAAAPPHPGLWDSLKGFGHDFTQGLAGGGVQAPPAPPQAPPSVPALGGMGLFPPAQPGPDDWLSNAQRMPLQSAPLSTPPPAFAQGGDPMTAGSTPQPHHMAAAHAPVPMPQSRPAEAPQPDPSSMGWFQRNALMQKDPNTGASLFDPQANATGPEVVQKFMNYLHRKDVA